MPLDRGTLFECNFCMSDKFYKTSQQFAVHLRNEHCSKEGGSYVCRYGPHNVCKTLPLEGVSDKDYEEHVKKFHLNENREGGQSTGEHSPSQPNLVKDAVQKYTVYSGSQNLAAILNDPRKTRWEVAAFFTRHWGESFIEKVDIPPIAHLPKITQKHFEDYITIIKRRHQRTGKNYSAKHRSAKSPENFIPKTSVGEVVPAMFFNSKFSLGDPQCFEALFLTENLDIVPEHIPDLQQSSSAAARREARLKPNKIMQEKLSFYLDAVEIQIARHISAQSASFFGAMASHDELQKSLSQTSRAAAKLRANIRSLDENICVRSLQILRLQTTRTNNDAVLKKLELISTVKQTQSMVQTLLHSCDFLGALELIATTQMVLKEELKGVVCFRHLSAQLNELESIIGKMLQEEFIKCIKLEFNRSDEISNQIDETMLSTVILGLLRVREYRFFDVLEEEGSSSIKNMIRETIRGKVASEDSSTDFEAPQGTLADQMRKMEFRQWFDLWQILLSNLLLLIQKIKSVVDVLAELIEISSGKSTNHRFPSIFFTDVDLPLSEIDRVSLMENLIDFPFKVCTYAQERCVRVLIARAKEGFLERLSIDDFLSIDNCVERFSDSCDQLASRKIIVLRACLQAQTSKIVQKFHEDRKNKLGNILDLEHWKHADVPLLFQEIVDEFEKSGKLRDVALVSERNSKPTHRFLSVKGENFVVIGTGLIIVQIIAQYCQLVEKLPSQASELMFRLVELLKNFNSRTCQLILGAGALQLVGLKTIGARNLALASRCLQLVLHFVPAVKHHFESYLPANQMHMLRHVGQMEKDYQDHIDEIFNKLLLIMETHVGACLQKWDLKPPAPSPVFQQLMKQMKRFYENIADVLPANQVQRLYLRIHDKFKSSLRIQLKQMKITPHDGALYSLVCSEFSFYMENLKSLPSCAAIDDSLQDVMVER